MEEFELLEEQQGGVCAICGEPERAIVKRSGKVRRLHVDHNHDTGRVRGLLCTHCNFAVGYVRERADLARRVADYIERNMLDEGLPDVAVEFPGHTGTADMRQRLDDKGIIVYEPCAARLET